MDFVLASSDLGRVAITGDAVAQIVGLTAAECYGVVGTTTAGRLGRLLARDRTTRGIEVSGDEHGLSIALHVIVEHGLNLAEVASTVRSRIAYEVGRMTGLEISAVEVHIDAVKAS
ncbi:MAG TPA: Asp23/Gls24 family envelope stress response protein [Gaiellaceae bacterium]